MEDTESLTIPIQRDALREIESLTSTFVSKWQTETRLEREIASPTGTGKPDDIIAIDYVIYEDLYDNFFKDMRPFIVTGAALLGNFLISAAGLVWKEVKTDRTNTTLCLAHPACSLIVPIVEMALHKYSGRPQFGTFETLFFDILFSDAEVESTHPLVAANLIVPPGEKNFVETHGYEIPKDILDLYTLYSLPDEEHLLRQLGVDAYNQCIERNWADLASNISWNDYAYRRLYGNDWKERFSKENEHLFE